MWAITNSSDDNFLFPLDVGPDKMPKATFEIWAYLDKPWFEQWHEEYGEYLQELVGDNLTLVETED